MGQSWSKWNDRRNAKSLVELAPKKTPGQEEPLPKLNRNTLLGALENVAASIAKKKGNVTVIAVGGAVNTIYLQSRDATHDVDFFNEYLTPADYENLVRSARDAAKRDTSLGEEWFNNRTILFIPNNQRRSLTDEAIQQGEVIFKKKGLTVLAAPWNYAFCCKVDRLAGSGLYGARQYDLSDAVEYLGRHLETAGASSVSKKTIQDWFEQYSLRWTANTEAVLSRIAQGYTTRFGGTQSVIS